MSDEIPTTDDELEHDDDLEQKDTPSKGTGGRKSSTHSVRRNEANLLKHTETIDKLLVQNKEYQKEVHQSRGYIDELEQKVEDCHFKIPKNILYLGIAVIAYMLWSWDTHSTNMDLKINSMYETLQKYDNEREQAKLYNVFMDHKLRGKKGGAVSQRQSID